ncbi:hypothetical protein [Actinoplanes awajinensis]|nr:hypothetical protein [Actinoplanes awajinensis]
MAFIEDDKLDALEATLLAFFRAAEIPVRDPKPADPDVAVAG